MMSGLEKILKHIESEAASSAKELLEKAKAEADKIVAEAKAEGEQKSAEIYRQAELEAAALLNRNESAARSKEKRMILDAKQKMISAIIESSKKTLVKLPDEKYFDVILKMIKRYALEKSGQILFSDSDLKRLPENFEQAVNNAIADKKGAKIKISRETRDINGGFILVYGEIEENCSFDALFSDKIEVLEDKVRKVLFNE
jgi:V/A-type H+-transporting ATPase subunit E